MTLREAEEIVGALPDEVLEAIATIVGHTEPEGGYYNRGGDSFWEEDATATLFALVARFRNFKRSQS